MCCPFRISWRGPRRAESWAESGSADTRLGSPRWRGGSRSQTLKSLCRVMCHGQVSIFPALRSIKLALAKNLRNVQFVILIPFPAPDDLGFPVTLVFPPQLQRLAILPPHKRQAFSVRGRETFRFNKARLVLHR